MEEIFQQFACRFDPGTNELAIVDSVLQSLADLGAGLLAQGGEKLPDR